MDAENGKPGEPPEKKRPFWERSWDEDPLERRTRMGLWPSLTGFGRAKIVGAYEVPWFEGVVVVEALVLKPAWMVSAEDWHPYTPFAWDDEWYVARPDFYLSEDGEELIGSYLAQPPITRMTRFALVFYDSMRVPDAFVVGGRVVRVPDWRPIPERLLRLIWLEA
jgi:hypothetical protein